MELLKSYETIVNTGVQQKNIFSQKNNYLKYLENSKK